MRDLPKTNMASASRMPCTARLSTHPPTLLRYAARRLCTHPPTLRIAGHAKLSFKPARGDDVTVLRARIFDTPTGAALLASMPHEPGLMAYGAEVYGPWHAALPGGADLRPRIPPGGLAYTDLGGYFCVFFGQDPAWPVEYVGQIDEGWEVLRDGAWASVAVARAAGPGSSG